jgi:hypothetical protein
MYSRLAKRLERVEQLIIPPEKDRISIRFAHVRMLPHTYVGEKHEVLIKGYPSEEPGNDCVIQEFPGPGPELKFEFPKVPGRRRTLLVRFLEADGDGRPMGYVPEHADVSPTRPPVFQ